MAMDWRPTLEILRTQFQALASRATGLHHLYVEVADTERGKMFGPDWFAPFSPDKRIKIIDGKAQYDRWDCSSSSGLPGVHPGFREPKPNETFGEHDSDRTIRDQSGVVRAVAVPMKLRQGFYCGPAAEQVAGFKALADAAATALAAAIDLQKHPFASDLTDIFRKPRGGVRYIFGDVPNYPTRFIAQGWAAGVLAFEGGVLVDLPISESAPDASHWLLLLHRLGWRCFEGCPLRANRFAWDGDVEVSLDALVQDWSGYPNEFAKRFETISKESFYSILGTKEAPLDVNLASVFAIQMLLADLEATIPTRAPEGIELAAYSQESWKLSALPALRTAEHEEAMQLCSPKVAILVATAVEREAVLKKMRPPRGKRAVLQVFSGKNTCFVGRLGVNDVVLCQTAMGSVGRDASTIVTSEIIHSWQPKAVIMAGMAFGKDSTKQDVGGVLVSERVISYEPQRLGERTNENRGPEPTAGAVLLNRFRNVIGWHFTSPSGRQCSFQIGPVLSGEKLVDNPEFKKTLFERFPEAIGGEMEGAGVAAAAERGGREWIIVKAICDWGDGTKTKEHQEFAAASSVALLEHVLNQPGALDALEQ